ncbi:SMC family ATPase [Streptomyces sp. Z26]|uniref:AAA family ATPase n=1 Tax=Streptomyces sp. Z26 TaxID=2500177 RepID=UPI000EF14A1E|nr:SMC family ATPase [Streptomyces sp. Z26]RLL65634.1 SMC family ATPase [Streptomyces sp. Z26]
MRPHRLTLTAFGPFGGTQRVDFDELCAAGLFLLHGATGAGKTSLLDGVCFALYGTVPGARQQPGGTLRSDHADPHTLTEVVLDVTVGGRRLEITRRPEQLRPKKTGTGRTRERAHSALREWDAAEGEWRALSRSHQEIGDEVGQLLGMSRDQFCQVALLPQGDFARFLRAGAEDRAKLLGRLFDTGRFAAVEEELARMRRSAQDEVREADEALLALAHRTRQAAGPAAEADAPEDPPKPAPGGGNGRAAGRRRAPGGGLPDQRAAGPGAEPGEAGPPGAPGDPALADTVLAEAAVARCGARERRDAAAVAARTTREAHDTAVRRRDEAGELARRQERFAEARRRHEQLSGAAGERRDTAGRLARARAAAAVAPAVALRAAAEAEHAAAADDEARGRARLPAGHATADETRLTELERETRQRLGALASARRAEGRVREIDTELAAVERESRADDDILRDADEWLSDWERRHGELRARVERAQTAATRSEHIAGRLEPARLRLTAARDRDRLEAERTTADEALLRARERVTAARDHWLDLKERRLRGIAAELAAALTPGAPCAVCGGTEHPAPARPGADHVDRHTEEAALARHGEAETAREDAARALHAVDERLTAARATAGAEAVARLADAVRELEAGHAAAHAEAAGAHAAREELERAEREHARRTGEQREAERRAAARTSHREGLLREQAELAEEVRRARGDAVDVAARAAELERLAVCLTDAAGAARAARDAARRRTDARTRAAEAARQAGFDSPEAAADAALDEARQRAAQEWLDRWQAEETAVAAELADERLTAAASRPPADPRAAETAAAAAAERLRDAHAVEQAARTRCAELDELGARAAADVRAMAPRRAAHRRVAALAHLTAGTAAENERKMRLETYVLAARLEQVAAAASARLARMSGGRYTLVHSAERATGRGRSGLGLHVVDSWTGVERDTATLSGGETFFASLALALGLADVVTDEAGGTPLDTLFIDEGFGSLDEDTLDEVLDVLDSLRERDRSVGIVSHVPDLRRRVPAQLEVVKTRAGSSVRRRAVPSGG